MKYPIICHPEKSRHIRGICINCYSRVLRNRNPDYDKKQYENSKKYSRKYRLEHHEESIKRQRDWAKKWRLEALKKLGNMCKNCGYSDVRALHIDHVNNDGYSERNIRKSLNRRIALELVDIKRYQLLCANCNWIKRIESELLD